MNKRARFSVFISGVLLKVNPRGVMVTAAEWSRNEAALFLA